MSAFSEYRRMDKIAETWRGTRASLVWLSEAPIVNAYCTFHDEQGTGAHAHGKSMC